MKQHPCWTWCEGQLRGIIENQKRIGELREDYEVEIWSLRRLSFLRPSTTVLTCRHGCAYAMRETKESRQREEVDDGST